ncbi:MAG: hydrogenase iron-sulfur subunit [Desulfarculus sp.]|nr:hydrogenase iron-sulfur subunit [Desulfarculus sp.]
MAAAKKDKDFSPEIVALYCRQCLDAEERPQEGARQTKGFTARLVMLPCSGKVEAYQLLKILEQGADGVLLVGCPENACRFLVGSRRAEKRLTRAGQLLDLVNMGAGRLALKRAADLTTADILALAGQLAEQVKTLGPSPMKGDSL